MNNANIRANFMTWFYYFFTIYAHRTIISSHSFGNGNIGEIGEYGDHYNVAFMLFDFISENKYFS